MVVDIGGGTVDITVHDNSNGKISVILPPMGNTWGGVQQSMKHYQCCWKIYCISGKFGVTLIWQFLCKMRINIIKFGYYQVRQRRSLQMGLKMETSFFSKCILCFLLQYSVK